MDFTNTSSEMMTTMDNINNNSPFDFQNEAVDTTAVLPTKMMQTGYQESYFGKDPLAQAKDYNCPVFKEMHKVDSYMRSDGTVVKGYWRSAPECTPFDDFQHNQPNK